jgi:hypothetical protein
MNPFAWFRMQTLVRPKRPTYIEPPDVPTSAPRQFYSRVNALVSWLNFHRETV